jgi:hypothetical protein
LQPPDAARSALLARVFLAPPARVAAALDALSRRLELPMALGQMTLDQLGKAAVDAGLPLSRATLDRLSGDLPVVVAVVGKPGASDPSICAAIPFRDAASARKALDDLGPAQARVEGASQRRLADEKIWAALDGSTLFLAGKAEHIGEAGALAIEGQRVPLTAQISSTIYPEAIAAMKGTTVSAALGLLDGLMAMALVDEKQVTKKTGLTPAGAKGTTAAVKLLLEPFAESQTVHMSLDLGSDRGLLVHTDLEPKPGTSFAKRTAATAAYAIDPTLPVRSDGTDVFAWSPLGRSWDIVRAVFGASGAAGTKAVAALDELRATSVGSGSCTLEVDTSPPTALCSWPLKTGVDGKRGIDNFLAFLKATPAWEAEALGTKTGPPRLRKTGDVVVVERKLDLKKLDEKQKKVMRALFGGETQRFALTARGGRILQAFGPAPDKYLAQLAKAGPTTPAPTPPALAEVTARTKDHETLVFLDVMGLVGFALKASGEKAGQAQAMFGAIPGLAQLKAPLAITSTGGATAGIELQIPYSTLANAVKVAKPYFGMMGVPAASAP